MGVTNKTITAIPTNCQLAPSTLLSSFHLQDLGSKTGTFKQLTNRTELYEGMKLQLSHVIEFTVDKISSKVGPPLRRKTRV